MAANISPIFVLTATNTWAKVTAADTTQDGTSAGVVLCDTAGTNGHFVQRLIFQPISTSGSTTTSAAAGRIYINNGSSVGTASNNILIKEIKLDATAVSLTATIPAYGGEVPLNIQMTSGYKIFIGVSAMAANTQWNIFPVSGDY